MGQSKCKFCNYPTDGVILVVDPDDEGKDEFHEDLCALCVVNLGNAMPVEENDPTSYLLCPKCSAKVSFLRRGECISCYEARCDACLRFPTNVDVIRPPLGWSDAGHELRVELNYDLCHRRSLEC